MSLPATSNPIPVTDAPPTVARAQSPILFAHRRSEAITALAPDVTKFKTELTDTFSTLTQALTSVKDVPSAEAALPKLKDLDGKLEIAKATMQKLADSAKATIRVVVKSTQVQLRELLDKVLAIPGVGEKVKSVTDSIMAKLNDLAG